MDKALLSMEDQMIEVFKDQGIDLILNVPCGKIQDLIASIDEEVLFPLSRESVGVGIAAGAYMAGAKPLLLIQNTGIGNSVINLASLQMNYRIPLPILMSWRGRELENIAAQNIFGDLTENLLSALGIPYSIAKEKGDLSMISQAISDAFRKEQITASLISPLFWREGNTGDRPDIEYSRRDIDEREIRQVRLKEEQISMSRYAAIEKVVEVIEETDPEAVVISNLGIPSKELYDVVKKRGSDLRVFYMLAGFGEVSAIGLGMALFSSRNIYVLDGDGSLFHNPNVFDAIRTRPSANLHVLALDNGVHSSTGDQMSSSFLGLDLQVLAQAYGFSEVNTFKLFLEKDIEETLPALPSGPNFLHLPVKRGNADVGEVDLSCVAIKDRLMKAGV